VALDQSENKGKKKKEKKSKQGCPVLIVLILSRAFGMLGENWR